MATMTKREFLKKRAILDLLRDQGYPTYAKLFNLFTFHVTKDPEVVAYMMPKKGVIVVNDDLDINSISTVVRHEILHEYFTHYARELVWKNKNKNKLLNHNTANIAGDYDISNKGYTDEDKYIVRTLMINNKLMRGLVTEDDRPDLVDKSFEEMLDILSKEDDNLQQQMQQQIQQNQGNGEGDSGSKSNQSNQQDDSNSKNIGNQSDSDGDNEDNNSNSKPGQIGYRGNKETQEKEEAERQAQIAKEKEEGSGYDDTEEQDGESEEGDADSKSAKIKKAFDDITSEYGQSDLEREVNYNKQKEKIAKKAKDLDRYKNSDAGRFEFSFTRFLKHAMGLARNKTWSKVNKTYANSGLIRPGMSRRKPTSVPSVNIYFDRSGSWDDPNKSKVGYRIVSTFKNYVKQGRLVMNLFYFSDDVYSSEKEAIEGGSTYGQPIMNHIQSTKPDNVVILTDDDIRDCHDSITVPGAVWLLFVPYSNGSSKKARSQNLIDHIHGKALTEIYDITY